MLRTITVASANAANMSFAEDAKQKAVGINVRTSHPSPNLNRSYMTAFADLKEKIDEMKRAADRLLQVTKELRETVSIPWIK